MLYVIKSAKQALIVESNNEVYEYLSSADFPRNYISDFTVDNIIIKENDIRLQIVNSNNLSFSSTGFNYKLESKVGVNISFEDIVTVIDYCLDSVRSNDLVYCIHGSAVYKDDKCILLLGSTSGLGKTTIALKLIKEYGYKLIGDDKVLIDQNACLVGGAKKVRLNKPILKKIFTEEDELINHNLTETSPKVTHIIQPITAMNGDLYVEKWEFIKTEFHLYEELSRKIRGISRRINNYSYALQSLDNLEFSKNRINLAKLMAKIPAETIYGDSDKVTSYIANK